MYKFYIKDITNEPEVSIDKINLLPADCISEIIKYKQPNDIKQSFYSWQLLLNKLNNDFNYSIKDFKLLKNKYNKPYINSNLFFNISHSKNMILIAISENEIGVDIENFNPQFDYSKISKRIFNKKFIFKCNFIKKWTKYEAFLKMQGTGIIKNNNIIKIKKNNKIITKKIKDKKNNIYYFSIYKK